MSSHLAADTRPMLTGSQFKTICAGIGTAFWVGLAVVFPIAALPPLGLLAVSLLITSPVFRLGFVLVGGMLVLNTTQDFGVIKVGYLLGIVIAIAGASLRILRSVDSRTRKVFGRLVVTSLVFSAMVGISWPVAAMNGTAATNWLRDAAPYLLFSLVPILALDAMEAVHRRIILGILIASGAFSAASFAIEILSRRMYADLPFGHVAFQSFLLPAALFSYAVAAALKGKRLRLAWSLLAAGVFTLLVVTGTRSSLLLVVAPIAILIASQGDSIRRWSSAVAYGLVTLGLVLVLVPTVMSVIGADTTEVTNRLRSILELAGNPSQDMSYQQRAQQTAEAWQIFVSNPVFGAGPGHLFQGRAAATNLQIATFNVDTGMSFPAKFGLVGLGAALLVTVALGGLVWSGRRMLGSSVLSAAMLGYFSLILLYSLLVSPFEDKGLSFGLLLLLALYGIDRREALLPTMVPPEVR